MPYLTDLLTWSLSVLPLALCSAGQYSSTPVPYQQAPSYYPGYPWAFPDASTRLRTCHVACANGTGDDAPNILKAFEKCGHNGKVIFDNTTYHVNTVMNITGLANVEVDIRGTLLWSTDISYWLNHSLPMGYQNQSTAFIFGGDKIHMHGNGVGTFNGNGQVWYDQFGTISNYPRRPHQITFHGLTDSVIEGINFWQSQMWTMTLICSQKVLLQDIHVNNTNLKGGGDLNTDGADTIYSSDITFVRWVVDNGDDNISLKANSTNILAENCTFYGSTGVALGSIGQFQGQYETIEDFTVRHIVAVNNHYAAYAKTWTGISQGTPPNGGGGGLGYMRNITMSDFKVYNAQQGFYITQCNSYSGFTGECDSSKFQIEDLRFEDMSGTLQTNVTASFQCSGAVPCPGIEIENVDFTVNNTGTPADSYLCSNVSSPIGFTCNGVTPQT